ncbi:hypothetical protein BBD42_12250 [Paenibacillus sp. BIHB 4019]|uniref:Uncharacterized protein n=1 Tax=Paenibacillus sp. BIHB 4019 TaxID=1870819 RepID=A0A1B2DHH9_9BACL|nr:hypothetical protein BBD42_12250 [Paenibacillus sp. BIHB 4019]
MKTIKCLVTNNRLRSYIVAYTRKGVCICQTSIHSPALAAIVEEVTVRAAIARGAVILGVTVQAAIALGAIVPVATVRAAIAPGAIVPVATVRAAIVHMTTAIATIARMVAAIGLSNSIETRMTISSKQLSTS